ncbi:MAG: glycosyltransferase [Acidobacteria bacterium]|nr:glycosyltransferase [Acidobacteriota bacterium]
MKDVSMQPDQTESLPLVVCALIVSHNCAGALRRTVAALEASHGREQMEILAVDNGSTDGSQRLDADFPNINMLRLPHFCGLTKARNIGIRTAKAEFLLLLEAGVEVEPSTAMKLAERLQGQPEALAVCPTLVDGSGAPVSKMFRLPDAAQVSAHWRNPASLPAVTDPAQMEVHDGRAVLIRKQTIRGINFLDEKFGEHWGDVELAYQIKRAGKRIVMAPDIAARSTAAGDLWNPSTLGERAAFAADAANGAAVYLGKHYGFGASFGFRFGQVMSALGRTLTLQEFGYNSGLLTRLISGYKIDGSSQQL